MGAFDLLIRPWLKSGKVLYTWDPLHKTGLVDKAVPGQDSFKWLQDMTSCCQQIFNTFNWGNQL